MTRVVLRKSNDERGSSGVIGFVACSAGMRRLRANANAGLHQLGPRLGQRAAQDAGINLTSVDRAGGITLGSKDGIDATITLRR